ncbi:MAG: hypothetical protein KAS04_01195 [Candidatus Aenigmarchaeota archaeon]|nr:hypothetical protein [Candidatus Aenigmarchaeota archaeon]
MAKRFTDTEKWKKPFIRSLQAPYKLLFLYILDECNHAGIWQVELDIASLRIGESLEIDLAKDQLKDHIIEINSGEKWFIPDFIEFQYGQLNPENRAHNSVIIILSKHKLLNKNKHLKSPLQGCKDKDMDKDMDKVNLSSIKDTFEIFWNTYHMITGKLKTDKDDALKYFSKLTDAERIKAFEMIQLYSKSADKQYIKKARTYLSDKNFNDEFNKSGEVEFNDPLGRLEAVINKEKYTP